MIFCIAAAFVLCGLWLAYEVYRAPVATEDPQGLNVTEPGRRLRKLLTLRRDRT